MHTNTDHPDAAAEPLLGALALGDSALPIGRFVHSGGLEAWLGERPVLRPQQLLELIRTIVYEGVAPLDGAVVAHAHRTRSVERLTELDWRLTARKLTPASRKASHSCGRQLAALAPRLAPTDGLVAEVAVAVRDRLMDGNLAVVEGTLARALGLSARDSVLTALRSTAAALLSAAVRLGAISPTSAQTILIQLSPSLAEAAVLSLSLELNELSSTVPEMDIHAARHPRHESNTFAT